MLGHLCSMTVAATDEEALYSTVTPYSVHVATGDDSVSDHGMLESTCQSDFTLTVYRLYIHFNVCNGHSCILEPLQLYTSCM